MKTIPEVRGASKKKAWQEAQYYVKVVSQAVDGLVAQVAEARALVEALSKK